MEILDLVLDLLIIREVQVGDSQEVLAVIR
jgi:hypothetical protein